MVKNFLLYSIIILILDACNPMTLGRQKTPAPELTQDVILFRTQRAVGTIPDTVLSSVTPASTTSPSTSNLKSTPITTLSIAHKPEIHEQFVGNYETLFAIPVGKDSIIQYKVNPDSIQGPNAIAIVPDENILIADPVSERLLRYDLTGHLLSTIELGDLGIGYVRDLRVDRNEIFLLETSYKKYRVHLLSLDGSLITSEDVPYDFPYDVMGSENTLEVGLTGIAIDCEGRIILEVISGSRLFPLSDVQKQADPSLITQGLLCNGKRYFMSRSILGKDPQVSAGEILYQTHLTYGFGGLHFLDVFPDGTLYLIRDDVVTEPAITVDETLHYVGTDGIIQGVARVPISEFYYPIIRNAAINQKGEVFVLLPNEDSLSLVRLNFYHELGSLIPGAEAPKITTNSNSP